MTYADIDDDIGEETMLCRISPPRIDDEAGKVDMRGDVGILVHRANARCVDAWKLLADFLFRVTVVAHVAVEQKRDIHCFLARVGGLGIDILLDVLLGAQRANEKHSGDLCRDHNAAGARQY